MTGRHGGAWRAGSQRAGAVGEDRLNVLCLDLEGVLTPEIWHAVADATRIDALRKTTRDIPVYADLMRLRLEALARHDIRLSDIQRVVDGLAPLPGAAEFLEWARRRFQVVILSDTFYEFAMPLMAQLGHPLLLCHRLCVADDRIAGYRLRQENPKDAAVRAFQSLGLKVFAAGDSFNDTAMLRAADQGWFFDAPRRITEAHPDIPAVSGYARLQVALEGVAPV